MTILLISWSILCDTAVYLLAGFAIAGVMQAWISGDWAFRWLSKRRSSSVILATIVGAPLPLCSCGVLPAAVTLRKKGASKGATLSFLISTPETSVTSILLTYALLGPLLAIYRPIAACITALVAGFVENFLDRQDSAREEAIPTDAEISDSCCCSPESGNAESGESKGIRAGLRFAFVNLFDDIFHWIVIGIVAAAAIQVLLPATMFQAFFSDPLISMLLMLVIGIPLYICAESSTPIAAALIAQGMNPGAALVLLLAGPATNIGAVGVLNRELGRRTVVVYLATIAIVTLLMGWLLNIMTTSMSIPLDIRAFGEQLIPQWLKVTGAIIFLVMGFFTVGRLHWWPRSLAWLDARLPVPVTTHTVFTTAILVLVLGYVGSGLFIVEPGEVGIVKRFGVITRSDLTSGLHYKWPYPIETCDCVPVHQVNRLVLGAASTGETPTESESDDTQSWVLIGDENIVDIKCAVHWGAIPEQVFHYEYGIVDEQREQIVRSVTLAALREVLGGRSINRGFTTERQDCQNRIEQLIRQRLNEYQSGIRIDSFHFLDAHAPPEVHDAFRDVASALEDKSTQINLALSQEARIVPLARGDSERLKAEAAGYAYSLLAEARGAAQSYLDLFSEYRKWPHVTRRRIYYETIDAVLPGLRKYIKPGGPNTGEIEIWLIDPQLGTTVPWQSGADMR